MSSSTGLKLVEPQDHEGDTILLERRHEVRRRIAGRVTAVQRQFGPDGSRNRICTLTLMDISTNGLRAMMPEPIDVDSHITVLFPPHGPDRGFDLYGRIVRCQQREDGYEVGIRLAERTGDLSVA